MTPEEQEIRPQQPGSTVRYRIVRVGWLPRYDVFVDFTVIADHVRYDGGPQWTRRVATIWGYRRAVRRTQLLERADKRWRRILDRRDGFHRLDRR